MTRYFRYKDQMIPEDRFTGFRASPYQEPEVGERFCVEGTLDGDTVRLEEGLKTERQAAYRLNKLSGLMNSTVPGGVIDIAKAMRPPGTIKRIR